MCATEVSHDGSLVNGAVVPHNDNVVSKMLEEMPQEQTHFLVVNVLRVQRVVETEVFALGTDRNARDHRDAVALLMMANDRGPATRRPGSANGRDQEKPGLVDEHQIGAQPRSVFFIRGHSWRFQCSIAASSRSKARLRGF